MLIMVKEGTLRDIISSKNSEMKKKSLYLHSAGFWNILYMYVYILIFQLLVYIKEFGESGQFLDKVDQIMQFLP